MDYLDIIIYLSTKPAINFSIGFQKLLAQDSELGGPNVILKITGYVELSFIQL